MSKEIVEKSDEKIEFTLDIMVDEFIHDILDIEECARIFITKAQKNSIKNAKKLKKDLKKATKILENNSNNILVHKKIRKIIKKIKRHNNSDIASTLEKSLFVNLFSKFDTFIGNLISILYKNKLELFNAMNNQISVSEVLQYNSIDELREVILDKEIETIKRKSYIEQFSELEKMFNIKLTKFDEWANFVESSQRRNLFTHCDGIISDQYLQVCKNVNYKLNKTCISGSQLKLDPKYFFNSCSRMINVAVMLTQTLWRKVLDFDIISADNHLQSVIFSFLETEHFDIALTLGKFSLNLPNISCEQIKKINLINYSIALNHIGKTDAAMNTMNKEDWTATIYDFQLAHAVLNEDYEKSKKLMIRIGKTGEIIDELSYHSWPLFKDFRNKDEFISGYKSVYGYEYTEKLNNIIEENIIEVEIQSE